MTMPPDDDALAERIAKAWTTMLSQVQLEALMHVERRLHGLTIVQRDIERLRVMYGESQDYLSQGVGQEVLRWLELAVQALLDSERGLPETLLDMWRYVRILRRVFVAGQPVS